MFYNILFMTAFCILYITVYCILTNIFSQIRLMRTRKSGVELTIYTTHYPQNSHFLSTVHFKQATLFNEFGAFAV